MKRTDDHARLVRAIEQLSAWLAQATERGRAELHAVRSLTIETNDLADALRRAVDDCRSQTHMQGVFSVTGIVKEMHPVVRDEVYRIAYEAIKNACAHSHGTRLEVSLIYGHDFAVRVIDNGVGIDPAVTENGKSGHFGLQGNREEPPAFVASAALSAR